MKSDGMLAAQKLTQIDRPELGDSGLPAYDPTADAGGAIPPSEAAFSEAARRFDPRALTRSQTAAMAALLLGHGAISERDQLILQTDPTAGRMAVARDLAAPRDAIRDWQERRAIDMERGRIQAVEASTRALAILARVAVLRKQAARAANEGRGC